MSEVHVKEGESLDSALKRFKRSCAKAGVLAEVRRRECYESPSVKRRKKSEAARKNRNKACRQRLGRRHPPGQHTGAGNYHPSDHPPGGAGKLKRQRDVLPRGKHVSLPNKKLLPIWEAIFCVYQ